jgi:hypothetical protein
MVQFFFAAVLFGILILLSQMNGYGQGLTSDDRDDPAFFPIGEQILR